MDEGEEECRICRGGHESGPLLYPCRCTGSIRCVLRIFANLWCLLLHFPHWVLPRRYVHQSCLDEWLNRTNSTTKRCELCHHPFKFSPVYAEHAPSRLPTTVFVMGVIQLAAKRIVLAMRTVRSHTDSQTCTHLWQLC
jgi:E3 ubiquitin-protein ligase MARCH6